MNDILNSIKGVHLGGFLEHELKKCELYQRQLAFSINEHPKTLNAIIKGNGSMNIDFSL